MAKEQILRLLGERLGQKIECLDLDFDKLQEIRIRAECPIILLENGREYVLETVVTMKDIRGIVDAACGYSGYAFEEEISRGYLTMNGGHRIGLTGRTVMTAQGVQTLKYISSLNIRIAHPIKGCAMKWKDFFYKGNKPCHILIISPPGCGKTTLLRDMVRVFSDGTDERQGVTVGVVDERSEIAGTYRGIPAYDLGMRTDILDGCPKSIGMEMLLRSMSPKVLAVDEIGTADVLAIENALRCGCSVLATLHGEGMEDFFEKPGFTSLVKEKVFERYVVLKQAENPGIVKKICDRDFNSLWEESSCI